MQRKRLKMFQKFNRHAAWYSTYMVVIYLCACIYYYILAPKFIYGITCVEIWHELLPPNCGQLGRKSRRDSCISNWKKKHCFDRSFLKKKSSPINVGVTRLSTYLEKASHHQLVNWWIDKIKNSSPKITNQGCMAKYKYT